MRHPANPIVRGVDGARRSRRYGHGLELDRIVTLDADAYAEEPLGRSVPVPGDGWPGLHSISRAGGHTFVDRLRRRPRGAAGRLPAPLLVPGMRFRSRGKPEALG